MVNLMVISVMLLIQRKCSCMGKRRALTQSSPEYKHPQDFDTLNKTWANRLEFHDLDQRVKVAILDTGIDLSHENFNQPRASTFRGGQPIASKGEPEQRTRIQNKKCFFGDPQDVQDIDGHGTQVAGIVLRLAPRAELYIARICEGSARYGVSNTQQVSQASQSGILRPRSDIVIEVSVKRSH